MTIVRLFAVALALGLSALPALPALAQGAARAPLGPLWYDGPNSTTPGTARMRLVFDATRAAALTPEQYWIYSASYKRNLAALSMRMPVSRAVPSARTAALSEVAARFGAHRVEDIALAPLDGARLSPHL